MMTFSFPQLIIVFVAAFALTYIFMRIAGRLFYIAPPRVYSSDSFPYVRLESSISHYLFWPVNRAPSYGDYVVIPNQKVPGYVKPQRLGKQVVCKTGDVLGVLVGVEYFCNRRGTGWEYLGRAQTKSRTGTKMISFVPAGIRKSPGLVEAQLKDGDLFVMGSHKYSYDSRYLGFVKEEKIEKALVSIF